MKRLRNSALTGPPAVSYGDFPSRPGLTPVIMGLVMAEPSVVQLGSALNQR